ncbi:TonB-dependent receptor [Denitratisoma sp. DHT3]|uniref:TonB-dependent receptor n=1 Tax=Denitratisoma sp. DHT3 TaxID=1981880 RepID=UPI001198C208|nr:TonB-dependent receptor [Denitratisoma sp. DHT3]QDX81858.1 TonB-dependent receptor [Denitratisoma sp. DHT3]
MQSANMRPLFLLTVVALGPATAAAQEVRLDKISVTATREARSTADVPQAIAVVGQETLDEKKMFNIKDALQGIPGVLIDSKNGGFDARLIIRGAGLKAPYGIREIMVLRDGVPLSDPDSFTRLDFVDTLDIERIEVAKGPGNLFASGSSGGAIQIFSKSVFEQRANSLRVGYGNDGTENYHLRYGWKLGDDQALAVTLTHRKMDNDWRYRNRFDTTQSSLKHGLALSGGDVLESEISYSEANMQLPGAMDNGAANGYMFDRFRDSGKQTGTSEAWKHSGRYSKVWFLNSKLEMQRGAFTFKPRVYFNTWYHYHPVTGIINETASWVWNLGTDLEAQYKHDQGSLVGGLTLRQERQPDSRKYQYGDVARIVGGPQAGRITATLSDRKGVLAEVDDSKTLLTGVYVQESWRPDARWIVDLGMRYDTVRFEDRNQQFWKFDYASGRYVTGAGRSSLTKTFDLPAPKLAVSYKLNESFNAFAMVTQAGQIPSTSEISNNPRLEAPIARNHELGLKGRGSDWQLDASLYSNPVRKEIVQQYNGGVTSYLNAGRTAKKGFELAATLGLGGGWEGGGHYAYADYKYQDFTELVGGANLDRAGKYLPFVPKRQYGVFMGWKGGSWRARLSANSWGEYWLDNANTEKYQGWEWVTNLSLAYERNGHSLSLNVDNLADKHYAFETKKDTSGRVTYTAGAPRSVNLTYRYDFQ